MDRIVLEHHSNLTPEEETRRQNLLSDNWDAPVVFTTQVQFLEALFGAGTRSARRMHQLANAVIIFDEIQTLPIRCVQMFNVALRFLVHDCNSTVVLCTATQPLLNKITPVQRALTILPEQLMISNENELFQKLKRVEVLDGRKIGGWNDEDIAQLAKQELCEKGSVLIIANTRSSARSLYQTIAAMAITDVYHLSTNMCPMHRLEVLNVVRAKLTKKEPVICVSTQLIEAGVDIDFGSVIRYLAGLDSIVQAAGRCNRNGNQCDQNGNPLLGNVWIINPDKENIEKLTDIRIGQEKTKRFLDDFKDRPGSFDNDRIGLKAIYEFYKDYFYARQGEMTYNVNANSPVGRNDNLFNLLSSNTLSVGEYQRITNSALPTSLRFKQSFQTAAKAFHVIDSKTWGVIVPYKEGAQIVSDLCSAFDLGKQYQLIKKAQRYSVNLFSYEFDEMVRRGAIREVPEKSGIFYLDAQYYCDQLGWCDEIMTEMKPIIL